MGRLDDMRAAAAKKPARGATTPKPAPVPTVQAEPPKAPQPVAVEAAAKEVITFACGHKIGVHYFKCKKCEACVGDDRKARIAKKHERYEANKAARRPVLIVERLPAGSVKTLTWDGSEWRGVLVVPSAVGAPEFTATASGEKGCYHALHDAYVAWLVTQADAKAGA